MLVLSNKYKWIKTIESKNISFINSNNSLDKDFLEKHLKKAINQKNNNEKMKDWSQILNEAKVLENILELIS